MSKNKSSFCTFNFDPFLQLGSGSRVRASWDASAWRRSWRASTVLWALFWGYRVQGGRGRPSKLPLNYCKWRAHTAPNVSKWTAPVFDQGLVGHLGSDMRMLYVFGRLCTLGWGGGVVNTIAEWDDRALDAVWCCQGVCRATKDTSIYEQSIQIPREMYCHVVEETAASRLTPVEIHGSWFPEPQDQTQEFVLTSHEASNQNMQHFVCLGLACSAFGTNNKLRPMFFFFAKGLHFCTIIISDYTVYHPEGSKSQPLPDDRLVLKRIGSPRVLLENWVWWLQTSA